MYKFDEEYVGSQLGYLKMEYFLCNLSEVSFKFRYSEFWCKATISYCIFGEDTWRNPRQIVLSDYSQRNTVQEFTYVLDEGKPHNAKIRIELDESTGYPSSGHYDFYFDNFRFN